jgi:phosphate transport system permease protein
VILVPVWLQFLWAIVVPAAALVGLVVDRRRGRRAAVVAAGLTVAVAAVGAALAGLAGVAPYRGMLLALAAVVPAALYVDEALDRDRGRLGLLAPVVVVAGAALGAAVVRIAGFAGPEPWLTWSFLTSPPSRVATEAGLFPAVVGSVLLIALVAVISFGLGVATAVFLEDYTTDEGLVGSITRLIQVNIANLAAVPSVVYGLLGLGLFANLLGLGIGTAVTAALTLSLLILPITIISAQEAIRSVPDDLRRGSDAMGATRWQTTKNVVLPEAMPGILTGTILALGRAIGETAPLIMIGVPTAVFALPDSLGSKFTAMPMQIFAWAELPSAAFQRGVVAAGVVTLLAILLAMNSVAIYIRNRYQTRS